MIVKSCVSYFLRQYIRPMRLFGCQKCLKQRPNAKYELESEEFTDLMQKVTPMLKDRMLQNGFSEETKVIEYLRPKDLEQIFKITDPEKPKSRDQLLDLVDKLLHYSVRTEHPLFFNQLYTGTDPVGYLSELLVAALNTNVHTYAGTSHSRPVRTPALSIGLPLCLLAPFSAVLPLCLFTSRFVYWPRPSLLAALFSLSPPHRQCCLLSPKMRSRSGPGCDRGAVHQAPGQAGRVQPGPG